MTEDELEYFRKNLRSILNVIFLDKPIKNATAYFGIWHQTRSILEQELSAVVNASARDEINKIKAD